MARHQRLTWIALLGAIAIGVIINLPALHGPLALDDYAQRAMIDGTLTPRRGALSLYDFVSETNRSALLDRGALPWWSDPRLSIRFLRPLSSALVWLDCRLFGFEAFVPHLVSFLFFAFAVLAAHSLYRTSLALRPAFIATTIFAISPSHTIPLVWLANRDILLSLAAGATALSFYVRWRADRRRSLGVASAIAFGAATLTGEYAVCLAGYVLAIELFRRGEAPLRRLTGLVPFALPFSAYSALHFLLGYGAKATGFYRDPLSAPVLFIRALPRTFSLLLSSSWLNLDEGAWTGASPQFLALAVACILAGLAVFAWWSRRPPTDAADMAWLLVGSLFALFPLAATEPAPRILGVVSLGLSAVIAVIVDAGWRTIENKQLNPKVFATVCAALAVGYVHLVRAPLDAHRLARHAVDSERSYENRLGAVARRPNPSASTVVVIRANYPPTVLWAPFMLRDAAPEHWWVLSQTFEQSTAIRTGANSLELIQEEGALFPTGPTDFFRVAPPSMGDAMERPGLRATVTRVDGEGRPKAVRFDFDRDLDDTSFTWIVEGSDGFRTVVPPRVGFGVHLPP